MFKYFIADTCEEIGTRLVDARQVAVNLDLSEETVVNFHYFIDEKIIILPITVRFLFAKFEIVSNYFDAVLAHFLKRGKVQENYETTCS